jgi:hypothetical protein
VPVVTVSSISQSCSCSLTQQASVEPRYLPPENPFPHRRLTALFSFPTSHFGAGKEGAIERIRHVALASSSPHFTTLIF